MKRPLLSFAPLAGVAALFLSSCAGDAGRTATPVAAHYDLLIGGYTEGPASSGLRKGVEVYRFDTATGDLTFLRENAGIRNPSWLLATPSGKHVYAVNELDGAKDAGRVSAFDFDTRTGALKFINDVSSGGDDPCHLEFGHLIVESITERDTAEKAKRSEENGINGRDQMGMPLFDTGTPLFVSNYSSGGMTVLCAQAAGRVTPAHSVLPEPPLVALPESHIHSVAKGPHIYCIQDLGTDKLLLRVPREDCSNTRDSELRLPAGTGPRHLVFDKSGRNAYLVGELNDTVTHLTFENYKLAIVKTYPLGETPAFKKGTAAAVRLSDDGRFLYATTRDPKNKIHVFAVDAATGALSPVQTIASGGRAPRDIVLSPDGRWMFAANQRSDGVAVFSRDPDSGRLTGPVKTLRSGSPSALIWVPAP